MRQHRCLAAIVWAFLLSFSLAQEGLTISGTISPWTEGEAELWVLGEHAPLLRGNALARGTVDADGQFSVVLPSTVLSYRLQGINPAELAECEDVFITPSSGRRVLWARFIIIQEGTHAPIGQLFYRNTTDEVAVGEAVVFWVYSSTDAEVRAVCKELAGETLRTLEVDHKLQEGWNEIVETIVASSYPEAYTARSATETAPPEVAWQMEYAGIIGMRIVPHEAGGLVETVTRNYPAAIAGIEAGDVIVEVDGQDVAGMSAGNIALSFIRGLPDTPVVLGVRREGAEEVLYFEVVRRAAY